LHNVLFLPCGLNGLGDFIGCAFDGGDFAVDSVFNESLAGTGWVPIDMNGARAAIGNATSEFGAGKFQSVTQNP